MNQPFKLPEITPEDVEIPQGHTLESWIDSRVARYDSRQLDWHALKFQADYDPKYRRAQMRYIGTGGTGMATATTTRCRPSTSPSRRWCCRPAAKARCICTPTPRRCSSCCAATSCASSSRHDGERFETVMQRARPHLGAARRLSRAGQRGHRRGADVRHHRQQQARDARPIRPIIRSRRSSGPRADSGCCGGAHQGNRDIPIR